MEKIVKFVVVVGKLCMCYPLATDQTRAGCKTRIHQLNPFKIFQTILCCYLVIYAVDYWSNNSLEGLKNRKLLSTKLYFFMQYTAEIFTDALIRTSTLYYWTELPLLYSELLVLWKNCEFIRLRSSRSTKIYICLISIAAIADLVSLGLIVNTENVAYKGSFVNERKSKVVPQLEVLMRLVDGVVGVMSHLSFVYATFFVAVFGPLLTDAYVALLEGFQREFLGFSRLSQQEEMVTVTPVTKTSGGYAVEGDSRGKRMARFVMDFARLRKCLTIYMNVSECYVLAIVFRCTISMNLALISATGISDNSDIIFRGDYLLFVGQIMVAVLMADIGTKMSLKMDGIRKELKQERQLMSSTEGENSIRRTLLWAISWNGNLTAFRLFRVDRSLLAGIGQTALVVLIFMFQLRVTEYQLFSM